MDEATRFGGELLGDALEDALELLVLGRRRGQALRFEAVLAEMIQLPFEEVVVEAAREGDALGIRMRGRVLLQRDELVDRLPVVAAADVVAGIGDARLE